jgi:NAD(P)-dependent dehydrogenase (short-subunit alcohol dehydrogenase family)
MGRLDGKIALIMGGGSGIGAAAAVTFARNGARVAIAEINTELGQATAGKIKAAGGEVLFVETDATKEASVRNAVEKTVAAFGKLNVLCNVVGGSRMDDGHVSEVDLSVWEKTMGLNVLSTILACRHALPEILKAGGGSVVNMSSGAALRGGSPKHIYTAAKGAIVSLTRSLAGAHAKQNVRVNAVCAGRILTERILNSVGRPGQPGPMVDLQDATGRVKEYPFWVGEPEDIANILLFLASDESRMITGAAIPADGGRSAY